VDFHLAREEYKQKCKAEINVKKRNLIKQFCWRWDVSLDECVNPSLQLM